MPRILANAIKQGCNAAARPLKSLVEELAIIDQEACDGAFGIAPVRGRLDCAEYGKLGPLRNGASAGIDDLDHTGPRGTFAELRSQRRKTQQVLPGVVGPTGMPYKGLR